jgi:hypothetical protein
MLDIVFWGGVRAWLNSLRPGEPPDGELDGGEGSEGLQGAGKVLEVLGEAAISLNREKVRSTIQRPGRTTKPLMSSLRLTISMRSTGTLATAAASCRALSPPSAQINSSQGTRRRILSRTNPAPSRS